MSWLSKLLGGSKKQPLDEATLAQLAKAGADVNKPTDVVNYLYLPDEPQAQDAAAALRNAGFTVKVRPAATGTNWLALANKDMIPSAANIQQMRELLEGLASRLGGDYDGWEAAVTS